MLSQRRRRLSVLSSTCQHVQFVSGAETDKFRAFSRPHPCLLVQLQVDRKLPLNWICLGVQRNRLCHIAGPVIHVPTCAKCIETSWEWNKCSNRRCSRCLFFRQPTGCMPWQHTAEVLCGKWVDLGVAIGFAVSASKCSQNFVSSIVPTCANMCHYVPAWANSAVCQLCGDRRPLWNSHDGVCINAMEFGVCAEELNCMNMLIYTDYSIYQ